MNSKVHIEVDAETAELLNAQAEARGISVSDLVAELVGDDLLMAPDLEAMRAAGEGRWVDDTLAEDVRRLAQFKQDGLAVPLDEVKAWVESWDTPNELPSPTPRKF